MRFEVKYPAGEPHEVELSGTVAVLGRDPSCDLVLNDARCSRRHAVVEAGPQGISIRDAGSANGIYVNGKKVERSALASGDVVRLGEVCLKVLPEEVPGTVVMAPEDLESMEVMHNHVDGGVTTSVPPTPVAQMQAVQPLPEPAAQAVPHAHPSLPRVPHPPIPQPSAPPPPPLPPPPIARTAPAPPRVPTPASVPTPRPMGPAPAVRPAAFSKGPVPRPTTVTLLAMLWMLGVLYFPLSTILAVRGATPLVTAVLATIGALGTLVSGLLGWGLWKRQGWARFAQIAFAILGLLTCLFTPAAAAILAYMFRGDVASHFGDRRPDGPGAGGDGRLEPIFAAAIGLLSGPPALLLLFLPFFLPATSGQ